jgi:hypothetical protein
MSVCKDGAQLSRLPSERSAAIAPEMVTSKLEDIILGDDGNLKVIGRSDGGIDISVLPSTVTHSILSSLQILQHLLDLGIVLVLCTGTVAILKRSIV